MEYAEVESANLPFLLKVLKQVATEVSRCPGFGQTVE
jgi:hypothetical protein